MSDNGKVDDSGTDVEAQRVARVYAESLLNSVEKQGHADEVVADLDALVTEVFPSHPNFETFLASGAVGRDRKEPVIRKAFDGRASELFVNFLLVLNRHDRLDLLRPIRAELHALHDQRRRRLRVQVRTAVPLPDDQQTRLRDQLRRAFDREPVLQTAVDPSVLGGLAVRVGDWLYDGTVRTRLDNLRNQLIERSSHEIQSGRDRFRSAE